MSNLFDKALESVQDDVKRYVEKSIDIVDQIHFILSEKNISQRELAKMLNKKESEISKWLSGTHNFTNRSISKLESVLDEDITVTPLRAKEKYAQVRFVKVSTYAKPNSPPSRSRTSFEEVEIMPVQKNNITCKSA